MLEINIVNIILLCLNIVFLFIGYLIAKVSSQAVTQSQPKSFFDQNKSNKDINSEKITIDERKHVIDIKTSGLEKKYDTLGETKKSDENIESSISKLKNLKR